MSDSEIIQLALFRIAERAKGSPLAYWLQMLADEITAVRAEARKAEDKQYESVRP